MSRGHCQVRFLWGPRKGKDLNSFGGKIEKNVEFIGKSLFNFSIPFLLWIV